MRTGLHRLPKEQLYLKGKLPMPSKVAEGKRNATLNAGKALPAFRNLKNNSINAVLFFPLGHKAFHHT